jgi:ankyrin repeat protein
MAEDEYITALYHACQNGLVHVAKLLLDNINRNSNIDKAIPFACENNEVKIVEFLLKDGRADPAAENNWAIICACCRGSKKIVEMLLKDGRADPADLGNRAIESACDYGNKDVVSLLLQDNRVTPTANALRFACEDEDNTEIVALLLEDGRVEPTDDIIRRAATKEIKDMLIKYKYRVDGKEYQKAKETLDS